MENILSLCCKNNTKESPRYYYTSTLPEEGIIAIIFQNIAYTPTSNYRKWFFNTYKIKSNETIKRDRSYSLHEEIDYDECLTERNLQKNGSIDSLLEEMYLCKEPLDIYYIPFPHQLLPLFETHIEYFDNNILSVKIPHGKIKFFEKNRLFFITFLFDKTIEFSLIKNIPYEIGKKIIYIDEITNTIIMGVFNIPKITDILRKMMMSEKTIISAHSKNCIFTDIIVYEFCKRIRTDILYFSISPILENSRILYKKINKKLTYYLIHYENPNNISSNFIKIDSPMGRSCGLCQDPPNYRKNLKNITMEILHDFIYTRNIIL
jgi:hypothetical protein